MGGLSRVFEPQESPQPSPAHERVFPTLTKQAVRELVRSFNEFVNKSKSDIHYEFWKDRGGLLHLTVSAMTSIASDSEDRHVIKYEFVGDPNRGEDEKYLLHLLADLEIEFGVKITPGKWY
jgi:hypothetical protein